MAKNIGPYTEAGINISKSLMNVGDKITVSYDGLLSKSGADSIYVHFGYGALWEQSDYIKMKNADGIFKAEIKVTSPGSLNLSFKDGADNWDNNSAKNYSFDVSDKGSEKEEVKKPVKEKKTAEKPSKKEPALKKTAEKEKPAKAKSTVEKKKA